jgi:CTP:molybdopterin cytidylyltransferase MocA
METFAGRPGSIVSLRCGDVWGAPVLFAASDYPALCQLRGDSGAKRYAATQSSRLVFVDAANSDAFCDIDVAVG